MFQYYKNPNRAPQTQRANLLSEYCSPNQAKNTKIFSINTEAYPVPARLKELKIQTNCGSFSNQQLLSHRQYFSPQSITDRRDSLIKFSPDKHTITEPNDLINQYKQEVQHFSNYHQVFTNLATSNDNQPPELIPYHQPKIRQSCITQPKLRMLILDQINQNADHAVYEYNDLVQGPTTDRKLLKEMVRSKSHKKEAETQTLPIANQLSVQPPTSTPPPQIGESISNDDPVGFSRVLSIRSRKDSMNKLILFSSHNPQEDTPPQSSQTTQKPFYSKSPEVLPITPHPLIQFNQRVSKFDYKPKKPIFAPYVNPMLKELKQMREKMESILKKKK